MAASATTRRRPQHLISPASSSGTSSPVILVQSPSADAGSPADGNKEYSSPNMFWTPRRRKSRRSFQKKRILYCHFYVILSAATVTLLLLFYSALQSYNSSNHVNNANMVHHHPQQDHPNVVEREFASVRQNHGRHHIVPEEDNNVGILDNNTTTPHQSHAIPHILIFTHRWNLLDGTLDLSTIVVDPDERAELLVLQENVRNIVALHPGATVRFLTDDDCLASLRAVLLADGSDTTASDNLDNNNNANHTHSALRLLQHFQQEPVGMFKADLCRGAALFETGGVYLDVDLGVRLNLWDVLAWQTEFATVRVHKQSKYPGAFFQAFTAATRHHAVLLRYVQLFGDYYEGRLPDIKKGQPLGVLLLKRAYDEIQAEQQAAVPVSLDHHPPPAAAVNDKSSSATNTNTTITTPTATTHLNATTELWQEVLYVRELQHTLLRDIPPPVWGTRRACKFIVLARRTLPVVVPFYSRIAGSRMCPDNNNNAPQDDQNKNSKEDEEEGAFNEATDTGEEEDKR